MRTKAGFLFLGIFFLSIWPDHLSTQPTNYPPRLKRSESFLGIHFDFHARKECQNIGQQVDREMVAYLLDLVQPDYVQCDCKGHPGISSYPTKVGNSAPCIVKDPLKIWREVTAERGVALYLHYSGVWDNEAVAKNPQWARVNEKNESDQRLTSVFGPYMDSLLIPQLRELCDEYQVDGVWVDGECWAVERDYGPQAIQAFQTQTGIQTIPRNPEEPHWFEFSEFNRQAFRNYLKHYVTALHQHNPAFQIASNWAYSSFMPEPVTIDIDFISGDYSAKNSVNSARLEGRCMVHQGKPWDLMAWSFTWTDGHYSTKTVPQLKQEAAIVLALGGGFQCYFPQKRDGSIRKWQMPLMAELARFCRQRQSFCHRAQPLAQIGLILSTHAYYRQVRKLFAPWDNEQIPLRGILHSLLEAQQVVDIVMEHHLTNRMKEYPLLIYPEWDYIEPQFKSDLLEYVRTGGNLLIIGPRAAALFAAELDVQFLNEPKERVNGLEWNGHLAGIRSLFQSVKLGEKAQPFGQIYEDNEIGGTPAVAASITSFGEGKIAATYLNLGERYFNARTSVSRDFLAGLVQALFPEPVVEIKGSHQIDVTVNRKNGKLMINLVNTAGPHANEKVYVFDEIPSTGSLEIAVRVSTRPEKVTLEPEGKNLAFKFVNGQIKTTVSDLKIHAILVIE